MHCILFDGGVFLGIKSVNDEAESVIGRATADIKRVNSIATPAAATVSDVSCNIYFGRVDVGAHRKFILESIIGLWVKVYIDQEIRLTQRSPRQTFERK